MSAERYDPHNLLTIHSANFLVTRLKFSPSDSPDPFLFPIISPPNLSNFNPTTFMEKDCRSTVLSVNGAVSQRCCRSTVLSVNDAVGQRCCRSMVMSIYSAGDVDLQCC